ncbi:MAG: LEA type 2 family protein [Opitutaceae bacterium]|jgi:LEA14-like dessication related protein
MRSLLLFIGLSLSLVLAGCGTAPERRLDSPAVQVNELSPSGETYTLSLRFVNPNTVPLVVSSSTHNLYLGETRIASIKDRDPIGIPQLGGVNHTVKLSSALAKTVRSYLAKHPDEDRASVECSLEVSVSGDDTVTLKTSGGGSVKAR